MLVLFNEENSYQRRRHEAICRNEQGREGKKEERKGKLSFDDAELLLALKMEKVTTSQGLSIGKCGNWKRHEDRFSHNLQRGCGRANSSFLKLLTSGNTGKLKSP